MRYHTPLTIESPFHLLHREFKRNTSESSLIRVSRIFLPRRRKTRKIQFSPSRRPDRARRPRYISSVTHVINCPRPRCIKDELLGTSAVRPLPKAEYLIESRKLLFAVQNSLNKLFVCAQAWSMKFYFLDNVMVDLFNSMFSLFEKMCEPILIYYIEKCTTWRMRARDAVAFFESTPFIKSSVLDSTFANTFWRSQHRELACQLYPSNVRTDDGFLRQSMMSSAPISHLGIAPRYIDYHQLPVRQHMVFAICEHNSSIIRLVLNLFWLRAQRQRLPDRSLDADENL